MAVRRRYTIGFVIPAGYVMPALYKLAEGFADDFDPLNAHGILIGSNLKELGELPMFCNFQVEENCFIELVFSKCVRSD